MGDASRADGRLRALDGLRALACLSVFLANFHGAMGLKVSGSVHTPLLSLDAATFAESGVGVALFLVLSGALLSVPFWRDLGNPLARFNGWRFAVRRALRIVPAYYACLAAIAIGSGVSRGWRDFLPHLLFVNNLSERTFYEISPQFWTIGVFMQLYVILPFVFIGLRRVTRSAKTAAALITGLTLGVYVLHVAITRQTESIVASHSTLAHLPLALMGVVGGMALVSSRRQTALNGWAIREAMFWAAIAGVFVLSASPDAAALAIPYGRYLLPWLPGLMTLLVVVAPVALSGHVLGRSLSWLGFISYGVYIYQVPVMEFVRRSFALTAADSPARKIQFALVSLTLTLVIAGLSYLLLERPIIRLARARGLA